MNTNKILIAIIAVLIIGGGVYFVTKGTRDTYEAEKQADVESAPETDTKVLETSKIKELAEKNKPTTVIGSSVEDRDITAYHFGVGDTEVMFIGGIHGGYSWNTTLVAYELIDYLEENPEVIPEGIKVTVVPVLNPDGLESVVGTTDRFEVSDVSSSDAIKVAGRFNDNNVDLNRNFDCEWQTSGTWQSRSVSGGDEVFSEPESQAIRDYVDEHELAAVVAWYSAAGGVYSSACNGDILSETTELTNVYADASGYPAFEEFDFYEITGDMVNWLASEGIPAISVLLTTRDNTEWSKNKAGVEAVLNYVAE